MTISDEKKSLISKVTFEATHLAILHIIYLF